MSTGDSSLELVVSDESSACFGLGCLVIFPNGEMSLTLIGLVYLLPGVSIC